MRQDIQDFVDQTMPYQGSFKQLAAMLPADDAELDELFAEAIRNQDGRAFPFLAFAALHANRKVDSRHLEVGVLFFKGYANVLTIAWKTEGDTPKYLLAAMKRSALDLEVQAAVFFLLAAWVTEGRGEIPRDEVITAARIFARKLPPRSDAIFTVLCAAHLLQDDGLKEVLSQFYKPIPEEKITELIAGFLKICKRPVLEGVAARPDGNISHGKTMRRSVERVGRNEPCPCGSGKKYKHCCIEKDEIRLNQSTEVEGVTRSELRQSAEMFLDPARMARCNPPDLMGFDPRKIARYLLEDYFNQLGRFRMMDKVAESFEQLGWSEDLEEIWDRMMFFAHHNRCKEVARRLLRIRPNAEAVEKKLHVSYRLLLAEDDPGKLLELLMEQVNLTLQTEAEPEHSDMLLSLALALLPTKLGPLGIYVARGMLPFLPDEDAEIVYNLILRARDFLNLPPEDLYTDIMDERLAKKPVHAGQDSDKLQAAQQKLEDKAKEVRQLKEAVHSLEREITLRENNPKTSFTPTNVIALPDQNVLSELRHKIEGLKTDLKERHNERNELRRELQKAQMDIEELRMKSGIVVDVERENATKEEEERTLLLPEESFGNQPVRLIEFPKKFEERLASFPRHVSRNAMKTLGELAGGEPAAFMGVVRLKACPTISRQRIGIDVRLLFRLLPDRVQVVDLINRKDLERRIKTLV